MSCTYEEALGRRVRHWRKLKNLTQKQLAARARVTQGAVSLVELGQIAASLGTVRRLSMALRLEPSQLMREAEAIRKGRSPEFYEPPPPGPRHHGKVTHRTRLEANQLLVSRIEQRARLRPSGRLR